MSFQYKAVYKSLQTSAFSTTLFFAESDEAALEKAKQESSFPVILSALICFEINNREREIQINSNKIAQITIKDDYSKD